MKLQKLNRLNPKQLKKVEDLIKTCKDFEPVTLTPSLSSELNFDPNLNCFFLLTDNGELISFLSLFLPEEGYGEAIAFTHPMARQRGFFKRLWEEALNELIDYIEDMELLFVTDGNSPDALAALEAMEGEYQYTEYFLGCETEKAGHSNAASRLTLEEITEPDKEINALLFRLHENIFFDGKTASTSFVNALWEDGARTFIAKQGETPVGLYHITLQGDTAYLYGFGILPDYQGQGLGKELLHEAFNHLPEGITKILLQVNSLNDVAYHLYTSAGFTTEKKLDYYF